MRPLSVLHFLHQRLHDEIPETQQVHNGRVRFCSIRQTHHHGILRSAADTWLYDDTVCLQFFEQSNQVALPSLFQKKGRDHLKTCCRHLFQIVLVHIPANGVIVIEQTNLQRLQQGKPGFKFFDLFVIIPGRFKQCDIIVPPVDGGVIPNFLCNVKSFTL